MLKASRHTSTLSASTFRKTQLIEKNSTESQKRELKERQIPHGLKGPFEVNLKKRIGRMIQHQGFT
jgi:hypothetical protein